MIGTGEVGRGIACRLRECRVRRVGAIAIRSTGRAVCRRPSRPDVAARAGLAEIVVLALPLTEDTFHLVDAAVLAHCQGAILMNVGRGPLLDETAVIPALDAGHLSAVALDVFEVEPLPTDSPLWGDPRAMVSPHIAGITTVAGAGESFLQVYRALARGEAPALAVDVARGY